VATVRETLDASTSALTLLARRGEDVADEWQYVVDLESAWTARFEEVVGARGSEPVGVDVTAAVERAAEEARLITDPHRAIDWLSTFPQIVLLALGEGT
jgi:hypothetical protein